MQLPISRIPNPTKSGIETQSRRSRPTLEGRVAFPTPPNRGLKHHTHWIPYRYPWPCRIPNPTKSGIETRAFPVHSGRISFRRIPNPTKSGIETPVTRATSTEIIPVAFPTPPNRGLKRLPSERHVAVAVELRRIPNPTKSGIETSFQVPPEESNLLRSHSQPHQIGD